MKSELTSQAVAIIGEIPSHSSEESCHRVKVHHRAIYNSPRQHAPWFTTSLRTYDDEFLRVMSELLAVREPSAVSARKFFEYDDKFTRTERDIAELKAVIARQTEDIALLKNEVFPGVFERDEYSAWVESEDADRYAGMYVAFVPGKGPIAAADTIRELKTKYVDHPLAKEVTIVSVPNETT